MKVTSPSMTFWSNHYATAAGGRAARDQPADRRPERERAAYPGHASRRPMRQAGVAVVVARGRSRRGVAPQRIGLRVRLHRVRVLEHLLPLVRARAAIGAGE